MKNVTPDVDCEPAAENVVNMTGKPREWVDGMLIHRYGALDESNMTALGLHCVVKNHNAYRVSAQYGLTLVAPSTDALDLELEATANTHDSPPAHAVVTAVWDEGAVVEGDQENILGDNVLFRIQSEDTNIAIPVLEPTPARLGYYGALLVDEGAVVRFPNVEYPIWKMALGKRYVEGFIMTPQGKGFYLEYHHDRPHWHQPLTEDSGGYYILAKAVSSDAERRTRYHLTGFHIPYGKAVYTRQGAIHCDPALTGQNWLVGYTDSDDFSTALVRNANGAWVHFSEGRFRPDPDGRP